MHKYKKKKQLKYKKYIILNIKNKGGIIMSRSWTPQEHYKSYYYMLKERGINLRAIGGRYEDDDFGFINMCFVGTDGVKIPFYNPDYIEVFKTYKELSYLFSNFEKVWEYTAEHPRKRKKVFDKLEEDLRKIEKHDIKGDVKTIVNNVDRVLLEWYLGDTGMYSQESFIHSLSEYIYELVMGKPAKNLFAFLYE